MRKPKLKEFIFATVLCLFSAVIFVPAKANSPEQGEEAAAGGTSAFVIEEGVLRSYIGNEKNVVVPEGVKSIDSWAFRNNTTVESILLPEGVISIAAWAFDQCTSLNRITLPESLAEINVQAFLSCSSLKEITIPKNVRFLGSYAFQGCAMLETVTIKSDCMLEENIFYGTKWLEQRKAEGEYIVVNGILLWMSDRTEKIIIPKDATRIGRGVFAGFNFAEVTIPSAVTEIGDGAFSSCKKLKTIKLNEGLKVIGERAFYGCTKLTSISVPKGVTKIGAYAFTSCRALAEINLPDSVREIGSSAFSDCSSLREIKLPSSLTEIEASLFYTCIKLASIQIPDTVTKIGAYAFYETAWLKEKTAAKQMILVNSVLLDGTSSTGKVIIPEKVTYICDGAFRGAEITSVIIPEGVSVIGDLAFEDCIKLTSVTIPEGVSVIGDRAFANCTKLTSVTLPGSITGIGDMAFYGCTSLEEISLPAKCRTIGERAFYGCTKLKKTAMQKGIQEIGARAFYNCTELNDITLPDSITAIGGLAFHTTAWLKQRQAEGSMVTIGPILYDASGCSGDVVIPPGITEIASYAFSCRNRVDSVRIPDSVIKINHEAFFGCRDLITIIAGKASYAESYAAKSGMKFAGYHKGMDIKKVISDYIDLIKLILTKNFNAVSYAARWGIKPAERDINADLTYDPIYGKSVIEDTKNHMLYYKEGAMDGAVNLVSMDMLSGSRKVLTQVDSHPIYLSKGHLYYTTADGVFCISTDGSRKERLVEIPVSGDIYSRNVSLIGISGDYAYYTYTFYNDYEEDGSRAVLARVKINEQKQSIIKEYVIYSYSYISNPVIANGMIYYISYNIGDGKYELNSVTLDGKKTNTLETDMYYYNISRLLADETGVYYLYRERGSTKALIKCIMPAGNVKILLTIEEDIDDQMQLYSVFDGYLYYASNYQVYRLSTDGTENAAFELKPLKVWPGYVAEILVKDGWLLLYLDCDTAPNETFCIKLDGSYMVNLGGHCFWSSVDATLNAVYYRVIIVPGEDGDSYLDGGESVYRRLKLPLKQY